MRFIANNIMNTWYRLHLYFFSIMCIKFRFQEKNSGSHYFFDDTFTVREGGKFIFFFFAWKDEKNSAVYLYRANRIDFNVNTDCSMNVPTV